MSTDGTVTLGGKWYIKWQSKATGFSGQGEPIFSSRKDALEECRRMDLKNPNLGHWPARHWEAPR